MPPRIRWRRNGLRLNERWKSGGKSGRPKIDAEIRILFWRISWENATWGASRIESELVLRIVIFSGK